MGHQDFEGQRLSEQLYMAVLTATGVRPSSLPGRRPFQLSRCLALRLRLRLHLPERLRLSLHRSRRHRARFPRLCTSLAFLQQEPREIPTKHEVQGHDKCEIRRDYGWEEGVMNLEVIMKQISNGP